MHQETGDAEPLHHQGSGGVVFKDIKTLASTAFLVTKQSILIIKLVIGSKVFRVG